MCCGNPARSGSPSLLGMQHSIARQKFRTKFHKCQREWRKRERKRTTGRLWHKFSCYKLWKQNCFLVWHMSCPGIAHHHHACPHPRARRCPCAGTDRKIIKCLWWVAKHATETETQLDAGQRVQWGFFLLLCSTTVMRFKEIYQFTYQIVAKNYLKLNGEN